jgi:hypothetical protein
MVKMPVARRLWGPDAEFGSSQRHHPSLATIPCFVLALRTICASSKKSENVLGIGRIPSVGSDALGGVDG